MCVSVQEACIRRVLVPPEIGPGEGFGSTSDPTHPHYNSSFSLIWISSLSPTFPCSLSLSFSLGVLLEASLSVGIHSSCLSTNEHMAGRFVLVPRALPLKKPPSFFPCLSLSLFHLLLMQLAQWSRISAECSSNTSLVSKTCRTTQNQSLDISLCQPALEDSIGIMVQPITRHGYRFTDAS